MNKAYIDWLEGYFPKYPDVPKEVIIKEDLLRQGINFTKRSVESGFDFRPKTYFLFTYDKTLRSELGKEDVFTVPEDIRISKGIYNLLDTVVHVYHNTESPYLIDYIDGKHRLSLNGKLMADVKFPKKPPYYGRTFSDGTLYEQVVALVQDHVAFLTAYRICQYFFTKEQCKFCDINMNVKQMTKYKDKFGHVDAVRDPDQAVEVIETMVHCDDPDLPVRGIYMTCGSIIKPVKGKNELEFNLEYVEKIRARIGGAVPLIMITQSHEKKEVKILKEAGVTVYNPNIEVWDSELFKVLCPGKSKNIGQDVWIKRMVESVDIMGEGNVSPNLVTGVEMAQPYGFKTVPEAIESNRKGFEFMMSHGVIPHLDSWCIERESELGGHPPIPLEFFIEMDKLWFEIWNKYKLPSIPGYGPMGGPGRAFYGNSAHVDMGFVR
jgi:CheY-like chemotaxis protein